jgi:hypothetical protein
MRLFFATTAAVGLILATALPAKAQCVSRSQLSGEWLSDDGGTYWVRRADGNVVWWVGQSGDQGRTWINVFKGTYDPKTNLIVGDWSDVRSAHFNQGTLTLKLNGTLTAVNGFNKVSGVGPFGGTRWFFHCADN